ncbi:hypothetical protein [Nonomuraea sp. NPDC005501]|uniref:hypothetical protein n=1 Tax=Nonomuraea sp. NPDC005501 TaxID=3156884 RepID=UPI0033A3616F
MCQVEPPNVSLKAGARGRMWSENKCNGMERNVLALILLSSCLLFSACGPTRFQVDPGVLDDVHSIGKVVVEATSEGDVDGDIDVINTVVIVVSSKAGNTVDGAVAALVRRGWNISADNRPTQVMLNSASRPDVHLAITPFYAADFENDRQTLERVKGSLVNPGELVVVQALASG